MNGDDPAATNARKSKVSNTSSQVVGRPGRRPWYGILYLQVLIAIFIGILIGQFFPHTGIALKPLGDVFVALIRMMIAPVIFCVVVQGIASVGDLKKVGRVGVKALVYFEVVSTLALITGILVAIIALPGSGLHLDPRSLDAKTIATYVGRAKDTGIVPFLVGIVPKLSSTLLWVATFYKCYWFPS